MKKVNEDFMPIINDFEDLESGESIIFKKNGYIIGQCDNADSLDFIREAIVGYGNLRIENQQTIHEMFDKLHQQVSLNDINELRLNLYKKLNQNPWFRPTYYSLLKKVLDSIIGSEVVMQKMINLSIMFPNDGGSNIPLHVDAHSGESPYQCVAWVPLTDAYETKSVYLLPPDKNKEAMKYFREWMIAGGREKVFKEVESELVWANVPYGNFLIFTPNLLHGSAVNNTNETRWSFNTRFKSLFSPYVSNEKGLGSFYTPTNFSPLTQYGLDYSEPFGFNENI
jgi:sporadic carbohydrate cluster 2OG-Fe(II) oxygenase